MTRVLNHFWRRWSKEYLIELRDAHRNQKADSTLAKPGEVVVIHDEGCPRGFWKLAVIEKLIVGKDGHTRGAVLRLPSKDGQRTTLQRPLQRIYPLEVASEDLTTTTTTTIDKNSQEAALSSNSTEECSSSPRPQRLSAAAARVRWMEIADREQNTDIT